MPIGGGTVEQRAAVRAELLDFERWIGAGRLQLRTITFEPVDPPYGGKWLGDGVIVLDDQLEGAFTIRTGTRHELCHALDRAEDLSAEPMDALDQIGADLEKVEAFRDLSGLGWRREAFAQTCEIAPFVTHLLATPCLDDDPRINEIATWLLDRVWTASEPPTEAPLAEPVVFRPPESGTTSWVDGWVTATTDPALVRVDVQDADGFGAVWIVDRETGTVVTDRDVDRVDLSAFGTYFPWVSGYVVPFGIPDVVYIGTLRVEVSELGSAAGRMLWLDETESWAPVRDGCWSGPEGFPRDVFIGEDLAWTAWFDGDHFTWARIGGA